jgi:ABC-type polysaccharide/polyol phosphate export permease
MVSSHIFFQKHIYNDMLLIATCRKLRPILYLNPFSYLTKGIRDQILKTLMPCVVRWQKIDS